MVAIKEVTHQGSRVFQENSPERFGRTNSEKKEYLPVITETTKNFPEKDLGESIGAGRPKALSLPTPLSF